MKVVFSILFVIAVIVATLVLCVWLMIYSASADYYPDIEDLWSTRGFSWIKQHTDSGVNKYVLLNFLLYPQWSTWVTVVPGAILLFRASTEFFGSGFIKLSYYRITNHESSS